MGVWTHVSGVRRHKYLRWVWRLEPMSVVFEDIITWGGYGGMNPSIPTSSVYVFQHRWHGFIPPYPRQVFMSSNTTEMGSCPHTHLKCLCLTPLTWVHTPIPTSSFMSSNTTDMGSYPHTHLKCLCLLTPLTWVHTPIPTSSVYV
jgi:hypothetical protein